MSVLENAIKAILQADTGVLVPLITGAIVTYDETGRNGIGLDSTPTLFTANGFLKPTVLIKERTDSDRGGLRDRVAKVYSNAAAIEIWYVQDGDAGYTTLETARNRVEVLLKDNAFPNVGTLKQAGNLSDIPDSSLDNAAQLRSDYTVVRVKG